MGSQLSLFVTYFSQQPLSFEVGKTVNQTEFKCKHVNGVRFDGDAFKSESLG